MSYEWTPSLSLIGVALFSTLISDEEKLSENWVQITEIKCIKIKALQQK